MVPVFVKAPPTNPDIVHNTSLRLEYSVDYVSLPYSAWVFVTEMLFPCHPPNNLQHYGCSKKPIEAKDHFSIGFYTLCA